MLCFSAWNYLRDIVHAVGKGEILIGEDLVCEIPGSPVTDPVRDPLALVGITREVLLALRDPSPTLILAGVEPESIPINVVRLRLSTEWGHPVRILGYSPQSLNGIFDAIESVGTALECRETAHLLVQRLRAQLMNWADNFYERIKNKKVVFLSSIDPIMVAGFWIGDLIKLASAVPFYWAGPGFHAVVGWDDVIAFAPDVIIVAPTGASLSASMSCLPILENYRGWEQISAVKRGEVIFCDGVDHFYEPGLSIRESAAILFSAIAGFDSGYITPRGMFQRLRSVELRRGRW
jgi:ABC-type Fe3+-hydroxamate transport system substrate-binding protein